MAKIVLNKAAKKGGIKARKIGVYKTTAKYQEFVKAADRHIEEHQRRYANAYQGASTFLAR